MLGACLFRLPARYRTSTFPNHNGRLAPYKTAIPDRLGDRCDFAQLINVYRAPSDGEARYSPAEVASVEMVPGMGQPDPDRICTSIIERQNLTIRMPMRRLTA